MECFHLGRPASKRLLAEYVSAPFKIVSDCCLGRHQSPRREAAVVQVNHSRRDQWLIWPNIFPVALAHCDLLAHFEKERITGYRTRPAKVGFRDGSVSDDYAEILVVGWAGVARPESGIRLLNQCPGCAHTDYSGLESAAEMIDWRQWTGDDFFMVWPLPTEILITPRVVEVLKSLDVKSYAISGLEVFESRNRPKLEMDIRTFIGSPERCFSVGRLSAYMPEDMALKYGGPLGLEPQDSEQPAGSVERLVGPNSVNLERAESMNIPDDQKNLIQIREEIQRGGPLLVGDLFTRLLDIAERNSKSDPGLRRFAVLECVNLCQSTVATAADLSSESRRVLAFWDSTLREISQPSGEDEAYEPERMEAEAFAAVLLDLMGYLPGEGWIPCLRAGLSLPIPVVKLYAVVSLLRRSEFVDPFEIEWLASRHISRLELWEQLRKLGLTTLMPSRWSAPEELAASDLVRWAASPMEMGHPPEEIEVMGKFPVSVEGGEADGFLFRFREYRQPLAPSEGWMAGIAGPFVDGIAIGGAWSGFKPWDSMSPEEHVDYMWDQTNYPDAEGE